MSAQARQATFLAITEGHAGQRLDNFLITQMKGVPKTRIYRAIRKGEVRVNKGRTKQTYRLALGDSVRIPPIRMAEGAAAPGVMRVMDRDYWESCVLFEDARLMIINKPANIPVHGGTGISGGLIERMRALRPRLSFLELAHRLDRATSGCIILAKKRSVLVKLHDQFCQRSLKKQYLCLVKGDDHPREQVVKLPLLKKESTSGVRHVVVSDNGKPSQTLFRVLETFPGASLMLAIPKTGRTHQIRVHATQSGFHIAGDEKYGDKAFNKRMREAGLKRLFLHSASVCFNLSVDERVGIGAALDDSLSGVLATLRQSFADR